RKRGAPQLRLPSRLAAGFEHARFQRFAGVLAGPKHELERLVMALASTERDAEQSLALRICGLDAAREHQRVAEHDDAVLEPDVEMSDPKLLVDERRELSHLGTAAV